MVIISPMGTLWATKFALLLLLFALAAGGLLLILLALPGRLPPLSVGQRLNNQPAGEVQGSFTVGQTFFSPYPGLYRIDVLLATYNRSNSGQITFDLTPGPKDRTSLVSIGFDASQVEDNRIRSFEFSPMNDSAGTTYFFYLEAPASRPGNAITAWTDSHNPYPEGMAYLGGNPVENDLAFVAYFQPSPWQLADIYLDRLARGKPGLWGNKAFYAVISLVYLALLGTFLALFFRKAMGEGQEWRPRK